MSKGGGVSMTVGLLERERRGNNDGIRTLGFVEGINSGSGNETLKERIASNRIESERKK